MSRHGNCYDSAFFESSLGMLKNVIGPSPHDTIWREAIEEITEYIEIFSTRQGRQASLGYLSPAANERKYYKQQKAV